MTSHSLVQGSDTAFHLCVILCVSGGFLLGQKTYHRQVLNTEMVFYDVHSDVLADQKTLRKTDHSGAQYKENCSALQGLSCE